MQEIQFIQITPQELQESILNGFQAQIDQLRSELQPKEQSEYLTQNESAQFVGLNIRTVRNLMKKKKLKYSRFGWRVFLKRVDLVKYKSSKLKP